MRITGITYVSRKTHKVRNFMVTLLILLLLLIVALLSVSAYIGWDLTHPGRIPIEPFTSNIVPEYKDVFFHSRDEKIELSGWLFQVKGSGKTVILSHEYGKNRLQFDEKTLEMIKDFISKGYNVLAFDFRNSGKSGGKLATFGGLEKDDLLGAIDYVKEQGAQEIVLMGFSTGASASLLAAADSKDVAAVIADSPCAHMEGYLENRLSDYWDWLPDIPFHFTIRRSIEMITGMDFETADPLNAIAKIPPRSVLLIHAKGDSMIPLENSKALYRAYSEKGGGNIEFWETAGDGHLSSYRNFSGSYMDKVFGFLGRVSEKAE